MHRTRLRNGPTAMNAPSFGTTADRSAFGSMAMRMKPTTSISSTLCRLDTGWTHWDERVER